MVFLVNGLLGACRHDAGGRALTPEAASCCCDGLLITAAHRPREMNHRRSNESIRRLKARGVATNSYAGASPRREKRVISRDNGSISRSTRRTAASLTKTLDIRAHPRRRFHRLMNKQSKEIQRPTQLALEYQFCASGFASPSASVTCWRILVLST